MREKPVDFFGVDFSSLNNNLGSFAKVSVPFKIYNSFMRSPYIWSYMFTVQTISDNSKATGLLHFINV